MKMMSRFKSNHGDDSTKFLQCLNLAEKGAKHSPDDAEDDEAVSCSASLGETLAAHDDNHVADLE